jgi:hypothetical protein
LRDRVGKYLRADPFNLIGGQTRIDGDDLNGAHPLQINVKIVFGFEAKGLSFSIQKLFF